MHDFEGMTFGMILGYIITYNDWNFDRDQPEEEGPKIRQAGQSDFDRF